MDPTSVQLFQKSKYLALRIGKICSEFTHSIKAKTTETPVDSDSTAARTDESSEDQDDPLKKLTNFAGSVVNGALKWLRDNL
ncbi:hypothetical protein HAX54_024302 [Datura stramonium]|uniref:Uncharacterized protein n=1 Tax=Datura stramonium TaxID=4076 RepID=A0ABS8Y694_DATST|nr:hypothetical protein [Datura stramonium]